MLTTMNNSGVINIPTRQTAGVILAGGQARRMGGHDKGLVELNGQAMVSHISAKLRPQVDSLFINANRNQACYARLTGCPLISDRIGHFAGPLAGMACALSYSTMPYLVAVPCDSPFLAPDLVCRLHQSLHRERADIAMAKDGDKLQPVFVLLSRYLLDSLMEFLNGGGRKIIHWYYQHKVAEVDFSDRSLMFENINTPEEKTRIEQQLRKTA